MGTAGNRRNRIGKYIILHELGHGGMGVVYLAEDTRLRRKVALKLLNPALAQDDAFVEGFRREARLLAAAYHPNVVHVHSLDTIDGHTVIDMEYVDGGTLAHHLKAATLHTEHAIRMASDVLEALDWCHTEGLVHRDVKPSNIIFDRAGRARVADFGLASAYAKVVEHALHSAATTGIIWGSPRYAPPEAWDGATPAPAWDIFSTGVVLYETLTGKPPFNTASPLTALKEMAHGPHQSVRELTPSTPPWFSDLIMAMMNADPSRRPQRARDALLEFASRGDAPVRPLPPPAANTTTTMIRPARVVPGRNPRWRRIGGWAAILALVLLGAFVWLVSSRHTLDTPAQAVQFAQRLTAPDAILTTARDPETARWDIYTAEFFGAVPSAESTWFVQWLEDGSGEGVVRTPLGLWALTLSPGDGGFLVDGHWAAYIAPDGSRLNSGTLDGSVRAIEDRRVMLAQLTIRSEADGAQGVRTIVLSRAQDDDTDTAFLAGIESNNVLPTLLYHDLLPAAKPWALRIDRQLPALIHSRLHPAPAESAITVDGLLNEPDWARVLNSAKSDAAIPGRPWDHGGMLGALRKGDAIVLGCRVPMTGDVEPKLRIALLTEYAIPASASTVYSLTLAAAGIEQAQALQDTRTHAWAMDGHGALHGAQGTVTAEIEIPFGAVGSEGLPPTLGRWRVNVAIEDATTGVRLVEWGWPELDDPRRGAMVAWDAP